jgi:LCP family protein required for cell wall assembly
MVSMERDTMTNILDQNGNQVSQQKMNAAYPAGYNAGGMSLAAEYAMQTIGTQAGIPVNHFVIINMDGLVNLVNDLGGIDVVNDSGATIMISNTEPEYTATVPYIPGNPPQHINGEQALVFARDRDTLPNGDYGRAAHQREVLTQIFKKLISLNTVFNYQKILNDISGDFKTNISFDNGTMFSLLSYKNCFNKMVSVQYQGVGEDAAGSDGIYASYQFMPANVDLAVQNLLRKSIGQSTISSLGSNMTTYEGWYGVNPPPYYMPSATVTTKGQTPVIYGVNPDGSYATITSSNSGIYVGANGAAVSGSQ